MAIRNPHASTPRDLELNKIYVNIACHGLGSGEQQSLASCLAWMGCASYWCLLGIEGMIHNNYYVNYVIIPATPSNPSSNPT